MKRMERLASLVLAMILAVMMVMPVSAEESAVKVTTGSISISNPVPDITYKIYKMFELKSYNAEAGAYVYEVTDDWEKFVTDNEVGKVYFALYDGKYVKIAVNPITESEYTKQELEAVAADIAQEALKYAEEENIAPITTLPKDGEGGNKSYTVSELDLGYYLVDSSLGALCSLTTVAPNSPVKEKNTIPTIDKDVLVDADHNGIADKGEEWAKSNDANIGDVIQYKTTIHAKVGAHDYVVHDRMGVGLTLDQNSIKIMVGDVELVKDTNYTVEFEQQSHDDSNVVCDFEIKFDQEWLNSIKKDTDIILTYSAVLNEKALIYQEANKNATGLDYGDNLSTEYVVTDTFTFMFDVVKTDESNKAITGAEFKLYADEECEKEIVLVDAGNSTYHVATKTQKEATGFHAATIKINTKNQVVIKGLANGTYYLKETVAPTGYNKLEDPVQVTIDGSNLKGNVLNGAYDPDASGNNAIQVINKSGTLLPETGGMGTTIFYAAGGVLVLAAVVVFVTKKRMSVEE